MQQHFAHLFATPKAITLAGITLAQRNPDGTFAVAIPDNIEQAKTAGFWDMITWFQHNGAMDYQRSMGTFDGDYTDVTNYNYGVVSAAAGYSLDDALSNAGRYNRYFGNTNNTDVLYGLRQTSIANITQGWQDYHLIWSKK